MGRKFAVGSSSWQLRKERLEVGDQRLVQKMKIQ